MTVKSTGCGFDNHSRKLNIYLYFIFSFHRSGVEAKRGLSSATQYATPPELGGKWETECLNTRFPLPTQLWISTVEFSELKPQRSVVTHNIIVLKLYNILTCVCPQISQKQNLNWHRDNRFWFKWLFSLYVITTHSGIKPRPQYKADAVSRAVPQKTGGRRKRRVTYITIAN